MTMPKIDWSVNVVSVINFFVIIASAVFSVSMLYFTVSENTKKLIDIDARVTSIEIAGTGIEIRQLRESLSDTRVDMKELGEKVQSLNERLFSLSPR